MEGRADNTGGDGDDNDDDGVYLENKGDLHDVSGGVII